MPGSSAFPDAIRALLAKAEQANAQVVRAVAAETVRRVDGGGVVYVFGSGHSSLLAEEAFHRAGGLVPVYPVLQSFLSPHVAPRIAGRMERLEGVAPILFARLGARSGDLFWVASQSGINAAAIEMAMEARKVGVPVVAVTSLAHSRAVAGRHSSGKKLFELADYTLDNGCPPGDAVVEIGGTRVAAASTIVNSFLYNWSLGEACALWAGAGKVPPVYQSANTPGGDAHNESLEAAARARIPLL